MRKGRDAWWSVLTLHFLLLMVMNCIMLANASSRLVFMTGSYNTNNISASMESVWNSTSGGHSHRHFRHLCNQVSISATNTLQMRLLDILRLQLITAVTIYIWVTTPISQTWLFTKYLSWLTPRYLYGVCETRVWLSPLDFSLLGFPEYVPSLSARSTQSTVHPVLLTALCMESHTNWLRTLTTSGVVHT